MNNRKSNLDKLYIKVLLTVFGIVIFVLIASLLRGDSPDLIVGDGNGYYAWTRSVFIDGDINFKNDFQKLYFPDPLPPEIVTPKGLIHNQYTVGMAILEIPGFLLAHLIALLTPFEADGISLPYQIIIPLSLVLLTLVSFYLYYQALINYGIRKTIALLFSAIPLIGTNLLHYLAKDITMSHASGAALVSILIFLASRKKQSKDREFWTIFIVGILMGLLILIRNTNLLLIPSLLVLFIPQIRNKKSFLCLIIGGTLMLFLQLISLFLLWGTPIIYSYLDSGVKLNNPIVIFRSLFGSSNGVFLYHPWYLVLFLINIVGLCFLKERRILYVTIIFSFLSLALINGAWGDFGTSFGHRAFIEILPILSFGAAITIENFPTKLLSSIKLPGLILVGTIITANFYLWGGYLLKKYPHDSSRTIGDAYTWITKALK